VPPKQASESETYSISSCPKVELLSPIAPPDALAAASYSVELLSPIAPPDAQAAASCSVELLSPIAPPDAQAAASYGFRLFGPRVTVIYRADRLGTIDLPTV
jgi:hypothetical protein